MELPPQLKPLLRKQSGLITRSQLGTAGVSSAAVRWRLSRCWRLVLPGVVATFTGELDPRQRLVAAQLFGGPGAVLASWTAAAWHGVESARSNQVRVMVPAARSARRAGFVVVTRTTRPDVDTWARAPLAISSRSRAVIDAAREVRTQRRADEIVIEAVQRRLVSLADLRHEVECGPIQGSRQVRAALRAAEQDVWSLPELDLVELVAGSSVLSQAWPNPVLNTPTGLALPTPDLWLDDVGLAVQVQSRRFHERNQDWDGTVMADGVLSEFGIVVLGVTPNRIMRSPDDVLRRIERTYLSLQGRARPKVVARSRSMERRSAGTQGSRTEEGENAGGQDA